MPEKLFQYHELIKDSFFNALLVPFKSEYAYRALLDFGTMPRLQVIAIATAASFAGSCATWLIGRVFIAWANGRSRAVSPEKLEKWSKFFNLYLKWLLLFSGLDIIGNLLVLISGVLKTRFAIFTILVLTGKILYYATF